MRQVVLYTLLSLDGVAEQPGDWMSDGGPEVFANLGRVIATQDDVLLGARTYDEWAPIWPHSHLEPFAGFINRSIKHVVGSPSTAPPWANTAAVRDSPEGLVRSLQTGPGRDIGVHGSITPSRSLLRAGLVDELRLVISPAIAGSGRRSFDDLGDLQEFELLDVGHSSAGTVFLHHRRRRG